MGTWFWGSQDFGLWGWLDGGRRVGAIYRPALNDALDDHLAVCRSIGWWYPFNEFCVLTGRPSVIARDERNRLHSNVGPALRYRDGYSLYAVRGTRVPANWVEDTVNLDPSEVLRVENVEQRAVGASLIGWPKMLDVLDAKVIDDSGNETIGQLIELTLPGLREPGRFLKAMCPRNGIICEGVPRVSDIDSLPIDTAIAAQAWRIGDPQSEFVAPPRRT
ncbi:DUF6745 domain-containing protein [Pseudoxanthomonas sp.]|uniref:DUF6745 domain-containing protein n=1 Tax=Pseudoxanthomonas sp. TaxID=1871049 RepID=UPI00261D4219|nr:hypothetical protein [Pseudoxanthomonas sp.]WDS36200.1 MAG: hypothetical protein O8I58_18345 [Pseudoxanthomonas sp.]